jgi:exonuclease SbcC
LQGECVAASQSSIQAIEALKAQDRGEQQRLDRLQQRVAHRTSQERSRWSALQDRRRKCLDILMQAEAVRRAERRLSLAEEVFAARTARVAAWRRQVQCLTECQGAVRTAEQKLAATLREAGQAAIRADDLARRFGLTNAVPCAGTDLQGQCQLLGDAREASTLIPSAQAAIARLAREKASTDAELATLRSQREALSGAPTILSHVELECERARARVTRLAQWSAKWPRLRRPVWP